MIDNTAEKVTKLNLLECSLKQTLKGFLAKYDVKVEDAVEEEAHFLDMKVTGEGGIVVRRAIINDYQKMGVGMMGEHIALEFAPSGLQTHRFNLKSHFLTDRAYESFSHYLLVQKDTLLRNTATPLNNVFYSHPSQLPDSKRERSKSSPFHELSAKTLNLSSYESWVRGAQTELNQHKTYYFLRRFYDNQAYLPGLLSNNVKMFNRDEQYFQEVDRTMKSINQVKSNTDGKYLETAYNDD